MEEADEDERTEEELLLALERTELLPPATLLLEELRTLEEELLLREALLELLPEERTLDELLLPEDRTLEELLLPLERVLELEELTVPLLRDDEVPELERVLCWAEDALLRLEEDTALDLVPEDELPEDRTLEEDEPEPEDRLLLWLLRVEEELEEERVCAIPSDAISERASTKAVVIVINLFIASQFLRLTV